MKNNVFLALHMGAGYHDKKLHSSYRKLASKCCLLGLQSLSNGKDSNIVMEEVLSELENSPLTNAGFNSNLNMEGEVEFDASIMEGKNDTWASVGCINGVQNPIRVANLLLNQQIEARLNGSKLVQPCMLAGEQASKWARLRGVQFTPSKDMITEKSQRDYERALCQLKTYRPDPIPHPTDPDRNGMIPLEELGNPYYTDPEPRDQDSILDVNSSLEPTAPIPRILRHPSQAYADRPDLNLGTIGAVCIDAKGNFGAAVSSGGAILKIPGRVGHAAMYGCGCWAENPSASNQYTGCAVSTSGCGEQLIKTLMARTTCLNIRSSQNPCVGLTQSLEEFLESAKDATSISPSLGGVLSLSSMTSPTASDSECADSDSPLPTIEFAWAHTCRSFVICYGTAEVGVHPDQINLPKAHFSVQPPKNCGKKVTSGGKIFCF